MFDLKMTAWFALPLAALYLGLIIQVILHRRSGKVAYGDGGDKGLRGAIRAQVNAGEQIPIFLLLFALCEATSGPTGWLALIGLVFVAGRFMHAYAMSLGVHRFRVIGTATNLVALILVMVTLLIGLL